MRKEAAYLTVLGCLMLGAPPAQAAPATLAEWPFNEGSGQVAHDVSGNGLNGTFGAILGSGSPGPVWTLGHDGGPALSFASTDFVSVGDSPVLEPQPDVAVEAWVRGSGSPGTYRYVLSKGSVNCDRSAYGLYSGVSGGLAFYVSDTAHFFISPQIAPSRVWDGAWHHVLGAYDGSRVQLWVDGAEVGGGTAANVDIFYGIDSRGVFLGTYRGSCDLGFVGDIDDVRVWDAPPAPPSNPPPPIPPVPGTPTVLPTSGGGGSDAGGGGGGSAPHSSSSPKAKTSCLRVSLTPSTVKVMRKVRVKATVRRAAKPASGVRVVISGAGFKVGARTNKKGTATITVKARKRGRLTVRVVGQTSSCPASTVRAK
jgi:hypothetical protein